MWLQLSGRLIGPGWIKGVLTQYLAVAGAVSGGSNKFLFPVASARNSLGFLHSGSSVSRGQEWKL